MERAKYIITFLMIAILIFSAINPTMVHAAETEASARSGSSHESESGREHGGGGRPFGETRTEAVLGTYELVLGWILGVWQSFEVFEGITIWNIIVTVFISFGLIMLIKTQFGDYVAEASTLTSNRITRDRREKIYNEIRKNGG